MCSIADLVDDALVCVLNQIDWSSTRQKDLVLVCKLWQQLLESGAVILAPIPTRLSLAVIEREASHLRWQSISWYNKLSEEFILRFRAHVDLELIVRCQILTEDFIEQHLLNDQHNWWNDICENQILSESFMERYTNEICWHTVSKCQKLSSAFMAKYVDKINWGAISIYQKLSEAFIKQHSARLCWEDISQYQFLSEEFMNLHADDLSWEYISCCRKLSESLITQNADRVDWNAISRYQKLSEKFIEQYSSRMNWQDIFQYQHLSLEFCARMQQQIMSLECAG